MAGDRKRAGRPKIVWDEATAKKVTAMSAYGTPQDEIAVLVGISAPTLRKLYKRELVKGMCKARLDVRQKLYECCMAGNIACLIFYAKTQLGWKEDKQDVNAQGEFVKAMAEAFRKAKQSVGGK